MDILIYILLCVITSVPYVYSVRRSLTPKYKSVRATLLYGLLICALMWLKLWLDFLKEDSLFTILFTQTMLFLLMKIFTKDSWVRVLKFFLIFSGSAVISELFCVLVFMGIGADIRSSKAVMYLPIGRFFRHYQRDDLHVHRGVYMEQNLGDRNEYQNVGVLRGACGADSACLRFPRQRDDQPEKTCRYFKL